jgi:hypothetical protein
LFARVFGEVCLGEVRFTRWRAGDHSVSPPAHDGPYEEGNGEQDGGRQKGDAQYAGSDQEDEHEASDNEVSGKAIWAPSQVALMPEVPKRP